MKKLVLFLCFVLVLAACGPSPEQQATMTATAITATAAAWTPTPTPTNTPTSTPTPTPTDTPTPTPTFTPTDTPTRTPTPTSTLDPNRYYASDGSFSIMIPEGWKAEDTGEEYYQLTNPELLGAETLNFFAQQVDTSLSAFAVLVTAGLKGTFPDLDVISTDNLTTPSGIEYLRLEIEYTISNIPIHQTMYFFDHNGTFLTAAYTRLGGEGTEDNPAIQEAIDSLKFGE